MFIIFANGITYAIFRMLLRPKRYQNSWEGLIYYLWW